MSTPRRRQSPVGSASPSSQILSEARAATAQMDSSPPARSSWPSHPFLPTRLEALLLAIYPLTLLLGSLFSSLSPHIRSSASTYSATHQSFQPPRDAPSYFATKRNVFNVYFVKQGWFWTTAALLLFSATHAHFGAPLISSRPRLSPTRRRVAVAARWLAATTAWVFVTQWFLGPPLIDRSFVLTGGACEIKRANEAGVIDISLAQEIKTNVQCKLQKGTWSGGIDISGHVFLLILGSALLWMEMLPVVLRSQGLREARLVRGRDGGVRSARVDDINEGNGSARESEKQLSETTRFGVKVVVGVVGLMWWMLLMTASFFHTWTEKVAGLVVAFLAVWIVYFLPRGVPAVRRVLGIPGL